MTHPVHPSGLAVQAYRIKPKTPSVGQPGNPAERAKSPHQTTESPGGRRAQNAVKVSLSQAALDILHRPVAEDPKEVMRTEVSGGIRSSQTITQPDKPEAPAPERRSTADAAPSASEHHRATPPGKLLDISI